MAPVIVNPDHIKAFADAPAFEAWLSQHHDKWDEVWLRLYKKGSGTPSITALQAIDVVLCWGWIDAIRKSYDEVSFLQRYTPRGRKSLWSQVNRDNVARLVDSGRMTEHGLKHVAAAKADGRWDAAYSAGKNMQVPPDLLAAIAANPKAAETFAILNRQNQFALAFRVGNLKTEAGRTKRIAAFVEMLARGEMIYPQGKAQKS